MAHSHCTGPDTGREMGQGAGLETNGVYFFICSPKVFSFRWIFGCFSQSRFSHFHCNAMRKAIRAHKNLHTNRQNEHTPGPSPVPGPCPLQCCSVHEPLMAGLGDWANFYFWGKFFKKFGQIFFLGNILFFLGKEPPQKIDYFWTYFYHRLPLDF